LIIGLLLYVDRCCAADQAVGNDSQRNEAESELANDNFDTIAAMNISVRDRFERWARDHLAVGFNLDEVAAALGASKRTLSRRVLGHDAVVLFPEPARREFFASIQTPCDIIHWLI